jgi:hypothetical protein
MTTNYHCVDMGASETRYISSLSRRLRVAPNNYTLNEIKQGETDKEIENNLDVSIENLDGEKVLLENEPLFPVRLFMGSLAAGGTLSTSRPNGQKPKMRQPINYYSALVSCALDAIYSRPDAPKVTADNS